MANQAISQLSSITLNGHQITYDIHGEGAGPVVMLVSGWCQDHRLFDGIVKSLSQKHRVLRVNWRGHSDPASRPSEDFGPSDQADDVIALLNALNIDQVIPVSTSHGGWANMEITERLGTDRVPQTIVIDWILIDAGPEFIQDLQDIQNPESWFAGRQRLFDHWIGVSGNRAVADHMNIEMASWGFDMWARACRVIENAYKTWNSPLQRMAELSQKRPIVHIYSQAPIAGYEEMQQSFKDKNSWFDFKTIPGKTHFPTFESPEAVVEQINDFVARLK